MRRDLVARPAGGAIACGACIALGFALGLFGSMISPWGFAPPPPGDVEDRRPWQPKPGEVLTAGPDSALVHSASVGDLADGSRVAALIWVRGRTGREAIRVTGCAAGQGTVAPLEDPNRRERWKASGAGIFDLVARAVCAGIESPDNHPKGQT